MYSRREGRELVESDKNTNVQKLIFGDTELANETTFGCKLESWVRRDKVKRSD